MSAHDPGQRGAAVGHGKNRGVGAQNRKSTIQGRLHVGLGRQEDGADEVVLQIRHQIDIRFLQSHGNGRRLVAAQLEVSADALNHSVGGGRLCHPLLEDLLTQTLFARTDQDDDSPLLHRMAGIVQGLLGLVQV